MDYLNTYIEPIWSLIKIYGNYFDLIWIITFEIFSQNSWRCFRFSFLLKLLLMNTCQSSLNAYNILHRWFLCFYGLYFRKFQITLHYKQFVRRKDGMAMKWKRSNMSHDIVIGQLAFRPIRQDVNLFWGIFVSWLGLVYRPTTQLSRLTSQWNSFFVLCLHFSTLPKG